MCNHWPLNVNSKKYRPVLERRGLNEQCRNLPQYRERSFTDTVSQKDEKPPPAGLDDTAIPHIEKPAWKKVQYHNTVNPHVPPPSKIIMSEIFNLYELSNYMKENDQNRISVLPECLLKAETNSVKKSYTIFITDVLSRNENIAWLTWCYRRTRSNGFPIEKSIHCCQSDHCIKSMTKNFLYTDSSRKTTRYELHDTRLRNPQIITVFRNSNNIKQTLISCLDMSRWNPSNTLS